MTDRELRFMSIADLGAQYRSGSLSPVEVTRAHLDAIQSRNSRTHDYITVTADRALADAASAEAGFRVGRDLGPLQGVPLGLKDLVDTKGIATTAGSSIYRSCVPDADGVVARRLAAAGSVLLGKTNMAEFAFSPYGQNPHYGTPPNPWDASRVPGGSSCGSGGAVSRGCAVVAIGSDTGGSIRIPASFCGIVGLKPTVQRVSRAGVVPLSWTLDSIGPLTRNVRDAAFVFDAIAGYDAEDPVTHSAPGYAACDESLEESVSGFRVGIVRDPFFDGAEKVVVERVEAAAAELERLGVIVEEMALPEARQELEEKHSATIMCVEGFACHEAVIRDRGDEMDPQIRERLATGEHVPAPVYARALEQQVRLSAQVTERMRHVDVLLTPTTLYPAPRIDEVSEAPARLTTRLVNFLGLCAISIPCGFTENGLPVGLQMIGKPYDERTLLTLAHAYERQTEWNRRFPPEDNINDG